MIEDRSFIGTGWSFPPTFFNGPSAGVEMVSEEDDVRQSLQIILSTTLGERNMHPDFGCDLNQYIFEELSEGLITSMTSNITKAILQYEPRIDLDDIEIYEGETPSGRLMIEITYIIRITNTRNNFVYPFYMNEGTELNV